MKLEQEVVEEAFVDDSGLGTDRLGQTTVEKLL